MKESSITPRFIFVVSVVLFGALMRLVPHWPNFTPIAAMALFGGAYFGKKYLAFLIPLTAMFLSDLILGFHNNMVAVYLAFSITVVIGFMLRKNANAGNVLLTALGSSVVFFLITNFASWLTMGLYPMTFSGLMGCYLAGLVFFNDGSMGLSFFLNNVFGTLIYSGIFFGVFYFARMGFPSLAKVK